MEALEILYAKLTTSDFKNLEDADILNIVLASSSLSVALLSLAISFILLVYAAYQYFLKSGENFHGIFAVSSSVWSNQRYVSELVIENCKDKSAVISTIYLRVGGNIFVELIDYFDSPKILGPFETIKITLNEGVSGYISSGYKVNISNLLADRKVRKTLMVATPKKIYKVKEYKSFWNVYFESLRNHLITPVRPVRKYYEGTEYSDALQFVIIDSKADDLDRKIFLYRGRQRLVRGLKIEVDNFSSATELNEYLLKNIDVEGLSVEVVGHNFGDYENYRSVEIRCYGFFFTSVAGRIYTKLCSLIFRFKNRRFRQ